MQAAEYELLKPQNQPKPNHFFLPRWIHSTDQLLALHALSVPFPPSCSKDFPLQPRQGPRSRWSTWNREMMNVLQCFRLSQRDDFAIRCLWIVFFGCWSNLRWSFLHVFLLLQDPGALNLKVYLFEYFNHTVSSIIAACFMNCGQFISSDTRKWKNKVLTVIPFHYTVASISTTGSVSETLVKQSDHFIPLTQLTKKGFGHCSCVWFFQNTIHPTNGWIRQWKYHSFLSHFFV